MSRKTNRREFLKKSSIASAGLWMTAKAARAAADKPNSTFNFASIGVGGKGHGDMRDALREGGRCVAICDINEGALNNAKKDVNDAKMYFDFRKMLEAHQSEIDAVTISTADHTHAVATMMAMKMGKATYTQKPLCHDVYEARMLTLAAKETGVATQMGNQGTANSGLREACEVIQTGAIGPVREVHVWTNRPVWPQGTNAILGLHGVKNAILGDKPEHPSAHPSIPKGIHWDLFLGTAPYRPYQPTYQPFNWRGWWDWGTGALGDMACHTANMAFMACKLGYPTSIQAQMSEYNDQTFPMWSVIEYEFPARGDMPPLKWFWYDGGSSKPKWVVDKLTDLAHGNQIPGSGSLIVGDKGTLFSPDDYGARYFLLPEDEFEGFQKPDPWIPRSPGHQKEWAQGILQDKPELCMSNFGYAGPLTETVVLGCVALRARGKKILWDGPNMKITNDDKLNQYIKREYRKGWTL